MTKEDFKTYSNRLLITPYEKIHIQALYDLKQYQECHRYNYSKVPSRDEVEKYINNQINLDYNDPKERKEFAILKKVNNHFLGYIGMKGVEIKE